MTLQPANCRARFKIPYGRRAVTTTRSYESARAVKSCKGALGRKGSLDGSWIRDIERIWGNQIQQGTEITRNEYELSSEVFIILDGPHPPTGLAVWSRLF